MCMCMSQLPCMSHGTGLTRFCAVKQIRVIAAFPELHEDVEESHLTGLTSAIHNVNVLHQNLGIPVSVRDVPCPAWTRMLQVAGLTILSAF